MRYVGIHSVPNQRDKLYLVNITRDIREFIELSPYSIDDRELVNQGSEPKDRVITRGLLLSKTPIRNLSKYVIGSIKITARKNKDINKSEGDIIEEYGNSSNSREAMRNYMLQYTYMFPSSSIVEEDTGHRKLLKNTKHKIDTDDYLYTTDKDGKQVVFVSKTKRNYRYFQDVAELYHLEVEYDSNGVANLDLLNEELKPLGYNAIVNKTTKRRKIEEAIVKEVDIYNRNIKSEDDKYQVVRDWVGINESSNLLSPYYSEEYPTYVDVLNKLNKEVFIFENTNNIRSLTLDYKLIVDRNDLSIVKRTLSTISPVSSVTISTLSQEHDITWYIDKQGRRLKEYRAVKSMHDIEKYIFLDIINTLKSTIVPPNRYPEHLDWAIDTETTGFGVINLSEDNPNRDHVVAIPMSWRENQAVVIFTKMLHLANVEEEYFKLRFRPILCEKDPEKDITFTAYDIPEYVQYYPGFNYEAYPVLDTITIPRKLYSLIFHNLTFDLKAFMTMGMELQADEDTLQIAFRANPCTPLDRSSRGVSLGLKDIARKVSNFNMLDLSDVVGKGHEAEYNQIADEDVALVYGGADGEQTRVIKRVLVRDIITPQLYNLYRNNDIPIMHLLAKGEFMGMRFNIDSMKKAYDIAVDNLERLMDFSKKYVGSIIKKRNIEYTRESNFKYIMKTIVYPNFNNRPKELLTPKELEEFNSLEQMAYSRANDLVEAKIEEEKNLSYLPIPEGATKKEIDRINKENKKIDIEKHGYYDFEFGKASAKDVIFKKLGYPEVVFTRSSAGIVSPSTGKNAVKIWLKERLDTPVNYMTEDLLSADGSVLISKDEFNSLKYPLSLVMKYYSAINKNKDAYLKPFVTKNLEGKIFKNNNFSRIVTGRIANALQTCNDDTKKMAIPIDDDHYMIVYDMSQVEYRAVISLFKTPAMIKHMHFPYADFHTETAATLNDIKPSAVTDQIRKDAKVNAFGLLYGMGPQSLAKILRGDTSVRALSYAKEMTLKFFMAMPAVEEGLKKTKEEATTPAEVTKEFREFYGFGPKEPIGKVTNAVGFSKYSSLLDSSKKAIARIERQVANFKIQSYARELFARTAINLYDRLDREGLGDKVLLQVTVHDEAVNSVHKSIHPFKFFKFLLEESILRLEGHTTYYIGAGVGNSWYEGKKQDLMHVFMEEMADRYEKGLITDEFDHKNANDYVNRHYDAWKYEIVDRIMLEVAPDIMTNTVFDCAKIYESFTNYTVRKVLQEKYPMNRKHRKGDDTDVFLSHMETYLKEKCLVDPLIIDTNGNKYKLSEGLSIYEDKQKDSIHTVTLDEEDYLLQDEEEDVFDDILLTMETDIMNDNSGVSEDEALLNGDALDLEYSRIEKDFYYEDRVDSADEFKNAIIQWKIENPGKALPSNFENRFITFDLKFIRNSINGIEIYCPTKETEKATKNYIQDKLGYTGRKVYIRYSDGRLEYQGKVITTYSSEELDEILVSKVVYYNNIIEQEGGYYINFKSKLSASLLMFSLSKYSLDIEDIRSGSIVEYNTLEIRSRSIPVYVVYLPISFNLQDVDKKYNLFVDKFETNYEHLHIFNDYISIDVSDVVDTRYLESNLNSMKYEDGIILQVKYNWGIKGYKVKPSYNLNKLSKDIESLKR